MAAVVVTAFQILAHRVAVVMVAYDLACWALWLWARAYVRRHRPGGAA